MLNQEQLAVCVSMRDAALNESFPIEDRRTSLAHLLQAKGERDLERVSAIPAEDLPAVAKLASPIDDTWTRNTMGGIGGLNVDGMTLEAAITHLADERAFHKLLAAVVDVKLPDTERIQAIRILKGRYTQEQQQSNRLKHSEQELLQSIRTDTGGFVSTNGMLLPVKAPARPPKKLGDVWGWWLPFQFEANA